MITARLYKYEGSVTRGLPEIGKPIQLFAIPQVGDIIDSSNNPNEPAYKVEFVVYVIDEDGVRLIVSPQD